MYLLFVFDLETISSVLLFNILYMYFIIRFCWITRHFLLCIWAVFYPNCIYSFVVHFLWFAGFDVCFRLFLFSRWVYFVFMCECWNGMFSSQCKCDVLSIISLTFRAVVPQTKFMWIEARMVTFETVTVYNTEVVLLDCTPWFLFLIDIFWHFLM